MTTEIETDIQPHAEWSREEVERRRRKSYADPINGSDRHFSEAARLRAAGKNEAAENAEQSGIVRADEIKLLHPYPAEE